MAIVKELIDLQQGMIEVESEPGKGAKFRLFIPYRMVEATEAAPEAGIAAMPRMEGICILVADDNRMNQRLMEHLLGGAGIGFTIVGDGLQVVERLRQKKYHLVLMDIQMPVMDGYEASRVIREDLRSAVPIIAMTAHAMQGEREKCLESGMNEYLSKPIDAEELFRMIARFSRSASGFGRSAVRDGEPGPKGDAQNDFKVIDVAYLQELSGGDRAYEVEMADQFLSALPEELGQLEAALAAGDRATASKVAHNMKTTVSIMGMTERLSVPLDLLEFPDGAGDLSGVVAALRQVCGVALEEASRFRR